MKKINSEIYYTERTLARIGQEDIDFVRQCALENERARCRLCMHLQPEDILHEMLIALGKQNYIRPHKHQGKAESIHIIDGETDIVYFTEEGEVSEILQMGDYRSGKLFFCRMSKPIYHMFLVRSEMLIFHETTTGPFYKPQTIYASWAPDEEDSASASLYVDGLKQRIYNKSLASL